VITASESPWTGLFTGLDPRAFARLVAVLRHGGADSARRGRPWCLPLEDRALLVGAYWRTDLTMRQLAPLFGVSKSAAHRIVDGLGPMLALQPCKRCRKDTLVIVNGALVRTDGPTGPGRSGSDPHVTGHRVVIDTETRLVATVRIPLPATTATPRPAPAGPLRGALSDGSTPPGARRRGGSLS
jgi:hypothetical protein